MTDPIREALAELVAVWDAHPPHPPTSPSDAAREAAAIAAARAALAQEPVDDDIGSPPTGPLRDAMVAAVANKVDDMMMADRPPTDDLVRRLHEAADDYHHAVDTDGQPSEAAMRDCGYKYGGLHGEAAAAIEALQAEVAKLQETGIGRTRSKLYNEMVDRVEAAEARAAAAESLLDCRGVHGDSHYCSRCDNSIGRSKLAARGAK